MKKYKIHITTHCQKSESSDTGLPLCFGMVFFMETTKICFKCKIEKQLSEFYVHKQMKDGHLNKCKCCTIRDAANRFLELKLVDGFIEKERERGREKYHRLGYVNNKPKEENFKKSHAKYKKLNPEKLACRNLKYRTPIETGTQRHHWSYNFEHRRDVIILTTSNHATIHRFLKYDKKNKMYTDLSGNLLDTKEKHLLHISKYIIF